MLNNPEFVFGTVSRYYLNVTARNKAHFFFFAVHLKIQFASTKFSLLTSRLCAYRINEPSCRQLPTVEEIFDCGSVQTKITTF